MCIRDRSWTLNQTLWDRFELGDVPATYAELLDMMLLWQDEYADEYPDYTLIDLEEDDLIRNTLGENISRSYIQAKRREWEEYCAHVSEWETEHYLYRF